MNFIGDAGQFIDQRQALRVVHGLTLLRQIERQYEQCSQLRGERLGGGDANLRPGVGVDGAIRFSRDHGANDVADGQGLRAFGSNFSLRGNRVRSLAGLRNQQADGFGSAMGSR